jgi:hypothetical protein
MMQAADQGLVPSPHATKIEANHLRKMMLHIVAFTLALAAVVGVIGSVAMMPGSQEGVESTVDDITFVGYNNDGEPILADGLAIQEESSIDYRAKVIFVVLISR